MDAMIRDCLLAPERTITQCRDTERTQRAFTRFEATGALVAADATDVTGFAAVCADVETSTAGGTAASSFGVGAVGAGPIATGVTADGEVSVFVRIERLSLASATARAIAISVSSGVVGGAFAFDSAAAVFGRDGGALFDAPF
jgi:hypothetical protein